MVDKQEIIDMIRLKSPRLELVSFEAGKSEAWRWFKRVRVDGAVLPYAVCNGCFKPVHYTPRDGTGGLRRHACPLTVAMAQAKSGLTQSKTPSPNSNARKNQRNGSGAATPDNNGTSTSSVASSPRSRANNGGGGGNSSRRSATVPVSLTMWAAEKGLVDLSNSAGLPSGGLSIASAFAALQGIVPRCSPYLTSSSSSANNPQAHQQQLQLPPISEHHPLHQQNQHHHHHHHHRSNGGSSPKMADSALDLAMKKSSSPQQQLECRDDDDDETALPEGRKAQSIVDHILLNISHQAKLEQQQQQQSNGGSKDANQNEQTSRFSIVPASRSSSGSTRRPRKRSNPDRAIPSNRTFSTTTNGNGGHHPDIEANLQMLAHVANEPPAVKRERISSPVDHLVDSYRYQSRSNFVKQFVEAIIDGVSPLIVNGGQLTPTSQHSVPSPAEEDGDHPASTSSAGSSTSSARKSGTSSPAQFAHHVPAHLNVPSSAADNNNASSPSTTSLVSYAHPSSPSTVLAKPVESFVAAMHQVLQGSPQCSLADAAQLIQLNDLTTCLHSLLDLHKKVFFSIHFPLFVQILRVVRAKQSINPVSTYRYRCDPVWRHCL